MDYTDYIKEIQDASKNNKLVFFVGAGVSRLSGYPSWTDLVNEFYTKLYKKRKKRTKFSTEENLQIPEKFYRTREKEDFDKILKKMFGVEKKSNIVHEKMMILNPAHFITTNYDELIEQACNKRGKYYSIISSDDDVARVESSKFILKVHGDFRNGYNSENIVLMEKDYLNYENKYALTSNLMKSILATYTIVFIGYGLGDHNIKLLLNWVKNLQKDGYKEPFFILTEDEQLDDPTKIYYEGKGLRIIESCLIDNNQEESFEKRYVKVLDRLTDPYENHYLDEDENQIINYIYDKICPLLRLSSIRKDDFEIVFDMKYHFRADGSICCNNKSGVNYLEQFFTLDVNALSEESQKKYHEIRILFEHNETWYESEGILGPRTNISLKIQNPMYHCDFKHIRELAHLPTKSLLDEYQRAYYLACLGRFKEAYEIHNIILGKAKDEEDWLMHYLSQINRYRLFQTIMSMRAYGVQSGDESFIQRIEVEMKDYKISDVFDSMPFNFQTQYKSLKTLSDNYYMYSDTVKLFERITKTNKHILTGSYSFGFSQANYAIIEMYDSLKFFYENKLWLTSFKDMKEYVKNSIVLMFDSAEYEATRERRPNDLFFASRNSSFTVDYYDFVNVCKSFEVADIIILERKCNLKRFEFQEQQHICQYIIRIVNEVVYQFSNGGMNYLFYVLFMEEAKSAVFFAKYIQFSNTDYTTIVNALLLHYPWRDVNELQRYQWTERLFVMHDLPMEVIPIIEEYLLGQALKHNDEKYFDDQSHCFTGLIRHFYKDYVSTTLSSFVFTLDETQDRIVDFMYRLSLILTDEAKVYLRRLKKIETITDVVDALRIGVISEVDEYSEIIIDYIEQRFTGKKGVWVKDGSLRRIDKYSLDFAIKYFLGKYRDERMKNFVGFSDQFDLFVSPETFDFEKFEVSWLRYYNLEVIKEMAKNEYMRSHLLETLKASAKESKDNRYYEILVACFL
ncbi:hypothetical protein SANA_01270 [Gottschalkiaceae bacterium SANA]|nr:hypothetical protein SANA_01270 [Gottschalkiaceae bacterium SANA]